MALLLQTQLDLDRCPHCNVDRPTMPFCHQIHTADFAGANRRYWCTYRCNRCGGLIMAASPTAGGAITELFPRGAVIDPAIPDRARAYLDQALNSLSSPAGAVMLASSAVDAMLKSKGLQEGSLYSRIDQAAREHQITADMAAWAHDVRLDANDQRHADDKAALPGLGDAQRAVEFALALAQFIFVLPARVQRGIEDARKG